MDQILVSQVVFQNYNKIKTKKVLSRLMEKQLYINLVEKVLHIDLSAVFNPVTINQEKNQSEAFPHNYSIKNEKPNSLQEENRCHHN